MHLLRMRTSTRFTRNPRPPTYHTMAGRSNVNTTTEQSINDQYDREESMDVSQGQLESETIEPCQYLDRSEPQQLHCDSQLNGSSSSSGSVSRKRTRPGEEEEEEGSEVEKRGCEEGMSWWTCLMLGISQDNSRQQVVKKVYNQHEK